MSYMKFRGSAHREFFLENMEKCRADDCLHKAFFYVMGITEETRRNIKAMFDFENDRIMPEGMHGGWQTDDTIRVCMLAFNLWCGHVEEGCERSYAPDELFCSELAPYFMEGIRIKYSG